MKKINQDKIIKIVFNAVDEINELLVSERRIKKSADTRLFDKSGKGGLDSLGLINFIVAMEQKIEQEFSTSIVLADERAMSQKQSPFMTVKTLVNYVSKLLEEDASVGK